MSRSVTHRLKCTACPHRITVEVDGPSFFTDGQRCVEGVATIAGWSLDPVRCTTCKAKPP
jgi:hypothetical protein